MARLSRLLRSQQGGQIAFWCPGCDLAHGVAVEGEKPLWTWNSNAEAPTIRPSINSIYAGFGFLVADTYGKCVCHSFVTDGQIQFLGDCTHALAGQTVPLPPWPEALNDDAPNAHAEGEGNG